MSKLSSDVLSVEINEAKSGGGRTAKKGFIFASCLTGLKDKPARPQCCSTMVWVLFLLLLNAL